jgi:hypothetical protein
LCQAWIRLLLRVVLVNIVIAIVSTIAIAIVLQRKLHSSVLHQSFLLEEDCRVFNAALSILWPFATSEHSMRSEEQSKGQQLGLTAERTCSWACRHDCHKKLRLGESEANSLDDEQTGAK